MRDTIIADLPTRPALAFSPQQAPPWAQPEMLRLAEKLRSFAYRVSGEVGVLRVHQHSKLYVRGFSVLAKTPSTGRA